MSTDTNTRVIYETRDGVASIVLNRPEKHNALDAAMREDLRLAVDRFRLDREAQVLIVTGAGNTFCAGADLAEMAREGWVHPPRLLFPDLGAATKKPTIAAVNGPAYGGGVWLAQTCDLIVASTSASFAVTEAKWGRGAPWAGALADRLPWRIATEMVLTGGALPAERAYQLGYVNRLAAPEEVLSTAWAIAAEIAGNAPLSVQAMKAMMYEGRNAGAYDRLDYLFEGVYRSADAQEGPRAFSEERKPRWRGN